MSKIKATFAQIQTSHKKNPVRGAGQPIDGYFKTLPTKGEGFRFYADAIKKIYDEDGKVINQREIYTSNIIDLEKVSDEKIVMITENSSYALVIKE